MSDKIYISFNKAFVRENIETKDGEIFHSVTLPKGVMIDGVDRGLYRFSSKYIYEDQYRPNNRLFSFSPDYEIKLTLNQKTADGKWEQADSIKVSAAKLKEAVMQQYKEYINSRENNTDREANKPNDNLGFEESELPFEEEPEL